MIPFQHVTLPDGTIEWTHYWDGADRRWVLKGFKEHKSVYFARHKTLSMAYKAMKDFEKEGIC